MESNQDSFPLDPIPYSVEPTVCFLSLMIADVLFGGIHDVPRFRYESIQITDLTVTAPSTKQGAT